MAVRDLTTEEILALLTGRNPTPAEGQVYYCGCHTVLFTVKEGREATIVFRTTPGCHFERGAPFGRGWSISGSISEGYKFIGVGECVEG